MDVCTAGGEGWSCDRSSDRYRLTRRLCAAHYAQHRSGRSMAPVGAARTVVKRPGCAFGGCVRAARASGLCTGHYQQQRKGKALAPLGKKRANGVVQEMIRRGIVECRECGECKPVAEYSPIGASGAPRPYCKPCNAERVRLGHDNVTKEFVDRLLRFQEARCAICGADNTTHRAMDIDHDHACCPGRRSCGRCVRGLICSSCNFHGLGWYEALPAELRTFGLLNTYLSDPPAHRLRTEMAHCR